MTMPAAAVSCLWTESYSMHRSQDTAEHTRSRFVVCRLSFSRSLPLCPSHCLGARDMPPTLLRLYMNMYTHGADVMCVVCK